MKKSGLIVCFLFTVIFLHAQENLPSFGSVDKADLEMTDCDFDPGAEAMVLLDVGEIEFTRQAGTGWLSETDYRIRIKVLKKSAVKMGQVVLRYYSKDSREEISNVSGISYNLNENGSIEESKLESKNIYDKQINKNYSEVAFALPNVKTATVFEYRYKTTRRSYSYIPSWNFQQEIPVRYSAFRLAIPEYFQFNFLITKRQELEKRPAAGNKDGTWYIMRNIRGLKDEPYSSGRIDYMQRMDFQLSVINAPGYYKELRTTWPVIIDELKDREDFGLAIKKNLKGIDEIRATVAGMEKTAGKIRAIYNYVQRNMQWNRKYGLFTEDGIKEAWDKKNGSIAEINFILINILQEAGVAAKPLLVSTKDHGAVSRLYPFLSYFNAVMCYVTDGDVAYIMNAADKYNPYNLVPFDVIGTNALVVDKATEDLIELKSADKFVNEVFFTCSIEPDGKISGQTSLKSTGYARNLRLYTYKKDKLKEMVEDNAGITIKVDSLSVTNEEDELQSLNQSIEFSGNLQTGGDYFFVPYSIFTGLGKNPFIAENRVMDIDFDYPKTYVVTGTYYLPDDLVINELPRNTKLIMPDTGIILSRRTQQDGNIISFRLSLEMLHGNYAAEQYLYVKDFFKRMYAMLDERIVLKKK
jgi:hypothetical protein